MSTPTRSRRTVRAAGHGSLRHRCDGQENQGDSHSVVEPSHSEEGSAQHDEAGRGRGADEASSEESESLLRIDVESTPIVMLGALLTLPLIAAVVRWPRREVFAVAVVFCLGFAVRDGREFAH